MFCVHANVWLHLKLLKFWIIIEGIFLNYFFGIKTWDKIISQVRIWSETSWDGSYGTQKTWWDGPENMRWAMKHGMGHERSWDGPWKITRWATKHHGMGHETSWDGPWNIIGWAMKHHEMGHQTSWNGPYHGMGHSEALWLIVQWLDWMITLQCVINWCGGIVMVVVEPLDPKPWNGDHCLLLAVLLFSGTSKILPAIVNL